MLRNAVLVVGLLVGASLATAAAPPDAKKALSAKKMDLKAREAKAPAAIKQKLAEERAQIASEKLGYTIGYTSALDVPLEVLAATRIPRELPPESLKIAKLGNELSSIDKARYEEVAKLNPGLDAKFSRPCSVDSTAFDWRKSGKVSNVKAQICGTCWDFTAMGTYESSHAIRNNMLVDTSEQYVLNCSNAGNCVGGWWGPVFDFLVTRGTATEASDPFTGNDAQQCPANLPTPFRVSAWGFVNTTNWAQAPTTDAIKAAMCEHGPLATAVMADSGFQGYTGGVYSSNQTYPWINHGVVIIGWDNDRKSWLIRNSWGVNWGETGGFGTERGYMWIAYGSNNIGIATAWVDAARRFYPMPLSYGALLESKQIHTPPLPAPDAALQRKLKVSKLPAQ